jgi:hypothetical protein
MTSSLTYRLTRSADSENGFRITCSEALCKPKC